MNAGLSAMMQALFNGRGRPSMNITNMKSVGGMSGGGAHAPSVGLMSAPSVHNDPMRDEKSPLAHGDEMINDALDKYFPTAKQQQAKTDAAQSLNAMRGMFGEDGKISMPNMWGSLEKAGAAGMSGPAQVELLNNAWNFLRQQNADDRAQKLLESNLAYKQAQLELARNRDARAAAKAGGSGSKGATPSAGDPLPFGGAY